MAGMFQRSGSCPHMLVLHVSMKCTGNCFVVNIFYIIFPEMWFFLFTLLCLIEATDLLQKLTIDPKIQTLEVPEPTKKKYGSDAGEVANVPVSSCEWSAPPPLQDFMDPNMCYLNNGYTSYYYGGYDVPINEWEDYPRYVTTPDGVEMPPLGVFGDNGSLMYHHVYGYPPYGPYSPAGSPVPTMGHDGQLYGPQHYQYAPYYHPPATLNGSHPPAPNTKGDNSISTAADQVPLPVEATNGVANGSVNRSNESVPLKSSSQNAFLTSNGSYGRGVLPGSFPACGYQDPRFGFDGVRSPTPWLDGPVSSEEQPKPTTSCSVSSTINPSTRNQNLHPLPHLMALHPPKGTPGVGPAPVYMNGMYANSRLYGQYGNMIRTDNGFGVSGFNSRVNGRGWLTVDNKYKSRGRGNGFFGRGNENMDGLNELNRGPRAGCFKDQKGFVPNITLAVKGQHLDTDCTKGDSNIIPDRNHYNRAEFPAKYSDVKFFIIKSYSEDDIHKSIKYSVWASTPNGNKKLDAGYCEAQGKSSGCPVFLFFSVNTSGQFVGVAEMVGPVDFNKNVEYWQQDKWNGCFPVKWHIIKDLPNGLLKHITLENNDYKPVTNSRDTQEVKFEQGLEMLKIFKDHTSKTCILDDFGFYEAREKTMLEKKAKQQQFHKQVCDGKSAGLSSDEKDKERSNIKARSYKPLEFSSILNNEAGQDIGEWKQSDRSLVAVVGNSPNGSAKAASEKRLVANGSVANGC